MGFTTTGNLKGLLLLSLTLVGLGWSCRTGQSAQGVKLPQLLLGTPYPVDLSRLSYPVEHLELYSAGGHLERTANDTYLFTPRQTGRVTIAVLYQGRQIDLQTFWVSLPSGRL